MYSNKDAPQNDARWGNAARFHLDRLSTQAGINANAARQQYLNAALQAEMQDKDRNARLRAGDMGIAYDRSLRDDRFRYADLDQRGSQFDRSFDERQRQFDSSFGEGQRQFDRSLAQQERAMDLGQQQLQKANLLSAMQMLPREIGAQSPDVYMQSVDMFRKNAGLNLDTSKPSISQRQPPIGGKQ